MITHQPTMSPQDDDATPSQFPVQSPSRNFLSMRADLHTAEDMLAAFDTVGRGSRADTAAALGCTKAQVTGLADGYRAVTLGKVARMPDDVRFELYARRLARDLKKADVAEDYLTHLMSRVLILLKGET